MPDADSHPLLDALEAEDYVEAARILASDPGQVTARDSDSRAAIHYAAELPDAEVFRAVLEADPSLIDCQDSQGFTPLFVCVTAGHVGVLRVLLEKGSQLDQVDYDKHTVVHWAVVCGQVETLDELLNSGAPASTPDLRGAHPLHYATTLNDIEPKRNEAILTLLLKAEHDVNCRDSDDRTPLMWAASSGHLNAVRRLIEAGANKYAVDRDHLNALHCAANHGFAEICELLLKQCQRKILEQKDKNGDTPLFYAATFGHYECARLLLEGNADPNHVDKRLRTAAHCAAAKGQMRILKLLRQYGASFDMQNYRGDLPFHEAVQTGNTEIVEWLLGLGPSNVDVGNFYGRAALHLAAANGDLELVKLLCERGANTNCLMIYRNKMTTPLDLAKQRRHPRVVEYLERRGAHQAADQSQADLENARAHIDTNVKSAKMRWVRSQTDDDSPTTKSFQRGGSFGGMIGRRGSPVRRSSSVEERSALPKSTSTTDLQMSPLPHAHSFGFVNREAQTDEFYPELFGRKMVEDAIRKVVIGDSFRAMENGAVVFSDRPPRANGDVRHSNGKKKAKLKSQENSPTSGTDDDYPAYVGHSDATTDSNTPKQKHVTMAHEGTFRAYEYDEEDEMADEFDVEPHHRGKRGLNDQNELARRALDGLVKEGVPYSNISNYIPGANDRNFVHEKAIFQELTHLKRIQIQYGKVREQLLVRSLINNFCKMHGLNPAHFRYKTFYEWEKFLYDQLKLIYLEERDRIHAMAITAPNNSAVQFERRLRIVSPLNERIRELTRIYANGTTAAAAERRASMVTRRAKASVRSLTKSPEGAISPPNGRRCDCLVKPHRHLLLKDN